MKKISINGLTSSFSSHRSFSLKKFNPYVTKQSFFPYKYKDPSFTTKFKGLTLKKDYFLQTLLSNRLNANTRSTKMFKFKRNRNLNSPNEILLNSNMVNSPNLNINVYNSLLRQNELKTLISNPFKEKYGNEFGYKNLSDTEHTINNNNNNTMMSFTKNTTASMVNNTNEANDIKNYKKIKIVHKSNIRLVNEKLPKLYVSRSTSTGNFNSMNNMNSQTTVTINNEYIKSKISNVN